MVQKFGVSKNCLMFLKDVSSAHQACIYLMKKYNFLFEYIVKHNLFQYFQHHYSPVFSVT